MLKVIQAVVVTPMQLIADTRYLYVVFSSSPARVMEYEDMVAVMFDVPLIAGVCFSVISLSTPLYLMKYLSLVYAILSTLIEMTAQVAAGSTPSTRAVLGRDIVMKRHEVQLSENIIGSVKTKTHA